MCEPRSWEQAHSRLPSPTSCEPNLGGQSPGATQASHPAPSVASQTWPRGPGFTGGGTLLPLLQLGRPTSSPGLRAPGSAGQRPRSRIAVSCGNFMPVLRMCQTSFQSSCTISHSHWQNRRIPVSPHSRQHLLLSNFKKNYIHPTELASHRGFDLHFPKHISCACWPRVCPVWRDVHSNPLPIFNWVVFLLLS